MGRPDLDTYFLNIATALGILALATGLFIDWSASI